MHFNFPVVVFADIAPTADHDVKTDRGGVAKHSGATASDVATDPGHPESVLGSPIVLSFHASGDVPMEEGQESEAGPTGVEPLARLQDDQGDPGCFFNLPNLAYFLSHLV